jgi:hypothetical protein
MIDRGEPVDVTDLGDQDRRDRRSDPGELLDLDTTEALASRSRDFTDILPWASVTSPG